MWKFAGKLVFFGLLEMGILRFEESEDMDS